MSKARKPAPHPWIATLEGFSEIPLAVFLLWKWEVITEWTTEWANEWPQIIDTSMQTGLWEPRLPPWVLGVLMMLLARHCWSNGLHSRTANLLCSQGWYKHHLQTSFWYVNEFCISSLLRSLDLPCLKLSCCLWWGHLCGKISHLVTWPVLVTCLKED